MHLPFSRWVDQIATLCQPKAIHFCDGSQEEYDRIAAQMVAAKTLTPLKKRPGSYWCRSHPDDVARVEECTFICSKEKGEAGPTNNWRPPHEMHAHLKTLFEGCMRGRTLYVVPYCMGPLGSSHARLGVELTDSPYVVLNMKLMTRMGKGVLDQLMKGVSFVPGVHSVGVPLSEGQDDSFWPCNPAQRVIAHFPDEPSIWSFGSGYGGNALLGKKCFALRIASVLGRKEGWLAEHMLILGITNPQGEKRYIAAAFPSACGKTNLAMMTPAIPGWKIECVGDDIAWIRYGVDGRLYAVNPEAGYFGVAPGTSAKTNPNALDSLSQNALFTNVALTPDGDVWWEGMGTAPPPGLTSWLGEAWDPLSGKPAAHPNSRFTVSATQCPIYDPKADDPHGVPLSAILFGGRRGDTLPLVFEARDWAHGVFVGASLSSETTAAAKGQIGKLRHDPFAMLPFCGYHMGDYFSHWLEMGERGDPQKLPKIFGVNWFLKGEEGRYLWKGYGENIRVLEWIFERCAGRAEAKESLIGYLPEQLNFDGLKLTEEEAQTLFKVDPALWEEEAKELASYFALFQDRLPRPLLEAVDRLRGGCKAV